MAREHLHDTKDDYLKAIRPANYNKSKDAAILRLEIGEPGMERDDHRLIAKVVESGSKGFDMRKSYGLYEMNPDERIPLMLKEPKLEQPRTLWLGSQSDWYHPGTKGKHLMKMVKDKMADLHTRALAAVLKKHGM